MAKSLLSKTSKPKKARSQTKKATKSTEYQFETGDTLIYLGSVIESENRQECKVVGRSRTHIQCFYKVEFSNGEIIECIPDILIFLDDFEEQLKQEEINKDNIDEMSEEEMRIRSLNIEPYLNKHACLSPLSYYQRACTECNYSKKCIYIKKGIYKKLDNN